ncbi:MAG: glycosyl hydrolase 2 galactose-binding domain-containing protein, partial [Limisphaerales bacterium]
MRPFTTETKYKALAFLFLACAAAFGAAGATPEPPILLTSGWQLRDAAKVTAAGNVISQPDYQPTGWLGATVPGTVLTSLVADGIYPDPLYGTNNMAIPDSLCRASYWYRTTFVIPRSYAGKRIWLNFDGINYEAEVWVNGDFMGTIRGAFARGIFDVTTNVAAGKLAALAVHVLPEPHPGRPHQKTIAAGVGRNGGVTAMDGPTFLCAIGWDW